MLIPICGAWSAQRAAADSQCCGLLEDVLGAARAANLNIDQFADALGVHPTALSRMQAFKDAGPGILRFANLPASWWVAFIGLRAQRYCLRVVTDLQIDKLIATLNCVQVRMARAELAVQEERKRA